MKYFSLILILFSLCLDLICTEETITCSGESESDCIDNMRFIENRHLAGDYSVSYTIYINTNRLLFEEKVSGDLGNYSHDKKDLTGIPNEKDSFSYLDSLNQLNPLMNSVKSDLNNLETSSIGNEFVLYGAIDLMNLIYTQQDGTKEFSFSVDQIRAELIDEPELYKNIKLLAEYLSDSGVCTEEGYNLLGFACKRFYITEYHRIYNETNLGLVNALLEDPLYIEVGIHPIGFQFYNPDTSTPIKKPYIQPTLAGVLTGYNFIDPDESYWEVYIRRHAEISNRVHISTIFTKDNELKNPFAGITANAFTFTPDTDTHDNFEYVEYNEADVGLVYDADSFKAFLENHERSSSDALNAIEYLSVHYSIFNTSAIMASGYFSFGTTLYNLKAITIYGDSDLLFFMMYTNIFDYESVSFMSDISSTSRRLNEVDISTLPKTTLKFQYFLVKNLMFGDNLFNDKIYDIIIAECTSLTSLLIGSNTFIYANNLKIKSNSQLSLFQVGSQSMSSNIDDENTLKLYNAENLNEFSIGSGSMCNFANAAVKNVSPAGKLTVIYDSTVFCGLVDLDIDNDVNESLKDFFYLFANIPTTIVPTSSIE